MRWSSDRRFPPRDRLAVDAGGAAVDRAVVVKALGHILAPRARQPERAAESFRSRKTSRPPSAITAPYAPDPPAPTKHHLSLQSRPDPAASPLHDKARG